MQAQSKVIVPENKNLYDRGSFYWGLAIAALQSEMSRQIDALVDENSPHSAKSEQPALLVIETETLSEAEKMGHLNGYFNSGSLSDSDRLRIEIQTFIDIQSLHVTDAMICELLGDRPGAENIQQIIKEVRNG